MVRRRDFLRTVLSGAFFGVAGQAELELALSQDLYAQTNLTPEAAMNELLAGNRRFPANRLTPIEHDLKILKEHTVGKQEPFAGVLPVLIHACL